MAKQFINGMALTLDNLPIIVRELTIEAIKNDADEELNIVLFDRHAEQIYDEYGGYNVDQEFQYLKRNWKEHSIIEELSKNEEEVY